MVFQFQYLTHLHSTDQWWIQPKRLGGMGKGEGGHPNSEIRGGGQS